METIIEARKLSCCSGREYLIKNIDWCVERGQHWVVFGMNGCGKTTLLSIISGFKKFTHGELKVFGEPYTNENILSQRKKIGFVSSSFFERYYKKETALDIVLSGKFAAFGKRGDISDAEICLAKDILQEMHLGDKINQPFDMMSRGEKQNVLLSRAFFSKPELLVLDEPCTGLDIFNREHLFSTIKELTNNGEITIIYVTHYTEEILEVFDNCLLLKNGLMYAKGKTDEMLTSKTLSRLIEYPVEVQRSAGRIQVKMCVQSHLKNLLDQRGGYHV